MNKIVFWQGQPSPHQSSYIRALADIVPTTNVVGVFAHPLERWRIAQGWQEPVFGKAECVVTPTAHQIRELATHDVDRTAHVFNGVMLPLVRSAMSHVMLSRAKLGVISEARDWTGWRGLLRRVHSLVAERRYRHRIDFVLAIGSLGVRWYEMCGYDDSRLFPWGYFVESPAIHGVPGRTNPAASEVRLAYVGQCVHRKGLDTLLAALAEQFDHRWTLDLVGDGPLRSELEEAARRLRIAERVFFQGVRSNTEVRSLLAQTDVLVLPSRFDGWGAVVNEALMCGVPVVCSDRCGAADLVRASGYGDVFRAGSVVDLARALHNQIAKGPLSQSMRAKIEAWSKRIEGEPAARYFLRVLEHVQGREARPVAPWLLPRTDPVASI